MKSQTAIEKAIEFCGGQKALGDEVGVSQPTVFYWKRKGKIPAEQVIKIEKITGIGREELRPDLFGEVK